MSYNSLDALFEVYNRYIDTTRFEVENGSKFIFVKNNKILKPGFYPIKDRDLFYYFENSTDNDSKSNLGNKKKLKKIEFIFNRTPDYTGHEGFKINCDRFIFKSNKTIGKKKCIVFSLR